jgi:hypothetical protein
VHATVDVRGDHSRKGTQLTDKSRDSINVDLPRHKQAFKSCMHC